MDRIRLNDRCVLWDGPYPYLLVAFHGIGVYPLHGVEVDRIRRLNTAIKRHGALAVGSGWWRNPDAYRDLGEETA
jgi:hypothetical protein